MPISFRELLRFNAAQYPILDLIRHRQMPDSVFWNSDLAGYSEYQFVIPGNTRWSCVRCGNCCRNIRSIGDTVMFDGRCPQLVGENNCSNYAARFTACKVYPFHIMMDADGCDLLLIHRKCGGLGKGLMFTADSIKQRIRAVSSAYATNDKISILLQR